MAKYCGDRKLVSFINRATTDIRLWRLVRVILKLGIQAQKLRQSLPTIFGGAKRDGSKDGAEVFTSPRAIEPATAVAGLAHAGWTTTGSAFGSGTILGGTWPGELPAVQGFIGNACVNTYRGRDSPTSTLASATFTLTKNFIHLLAGGGNNTNLTAVRLLIGTNIVRVATGQQSGTLYWNSWDVSAYFGQSQNAEQLFSLFRTSTLQAKPLKTGLFMDQFDANSKGFILTFILTLAF